MATTRRRPFENCLVSEGYVIWYSRKSANRDNLPNPVFDSGDPYVPQNMPAISDLFEMFNFQGGDAQAVTG